jgi:hypothetical protein
VFSFYKERVVSEKKGLKDQMPKVASMVAKARADWGSAHVDQCVQAGVRGQADAFYAIEGGLVVGTPFTPGAVMRDVGMAFMVGGAAMAMRQPDAAEAAGVKP